MELYRKKINIDNNVNRRLRDRLNESDNYPQRDKNNIIFQKMLKKKGVSQPKNEFLNLSTENMQNVRSSVEDILSNEKKKKECYKIRNTNR